MRITFIVIGLVFASFFLLNRCSQRDTVSTDNMQNNPIQQRQSVLEQIVLLQPLKQHAVTEYETIQQTANAAIQPQEIQSAVSSTLWWKLREIVEKQADDEGQRLWTNAYLQQLYDARQRGNCFPVSFPLYSRVSADERRALFSPKTQQQSADALTYILTHQGKRSVLESRQAPPEWQHIAEKLRQDYAEDADLINAGETAADKKKQCDVVIRTFEYILSLPVEQQGPVIRWMLNTHISVGVF